MIDLHSHSTFSDGEKTPGELVEMAHNIGLSALALTDHDTVSGCQELQQAAQKYPDLLAINGVEFKVDHPADIEIIALNVSNLNPYLTREKMLLKNREETSYQRVEKLSQLGYHIALMNLATKEKLLPNHISSTICWLPDKLRIKSLPIVSYWMRAVRPMSKPKLQQQRKQ